MPKPKVKYNLSFSKPINNYQGNNILIRLYGTHNNRLAEASYKIPKPQSVSSKLTEVPIRVNEGIIYADPTGKGLGNVALKGAHNLFTQIVARTKRPLHHTVLTTSPESEKLYERQGYSKINSEQMRRKFHPTDHQPKLMSMNKEEALMFLMGDSEYEKTKPKK